MRAELIGGPFDRAPRDVEDDPPDVVLCTDPGDAKREHLYRLRGVEPVAGERRAVYDYAPQAASAAGP